MNKGALFLLYLFLICACSAQKQDVALPGYVIGSEIILNLEPGTNIEEFIKQIKKPHFTLKETLSARMDIYVIQFDDQKFDPSRTLKMLKNHANVKTAEFNKKVDLREQN